MRTATAWPSCFETHRSALGLWKRLRSRPAAMLLSMRTTVRGAFWPNEATWENQPAAVRKDRRPRSVVSGLLFTMDSATPTCRTLSARSDRAPQLPYWQRDAGSGWRPQQIDPCIYKPPRLGL